MVPPRQAAGHRPQALPPLSGRQASGLLAAAPKFVQPGAVLALTMWWPQTEPLAEALLVPWGSAAHAKPSPLGASLCGKWSKCSKTSSCPRQPEGEQHTRTTLAGPIAHTQPQSGPDFSGLQQIRKSRWPRFDTVSRAKTTGNRPAQSCGAGFRLDGSAGLARPRVPGFGRVAGDEDTAVSLTLTPLVPTRRTGGGAASAVLPERAEGARPDAGRVEAWPAERKF